MLADHLLAYIRTEEEAEWFAESLDRAVQALARSKPDNVGKLLAQYLGKEAADDVKRYQQETSEAWEEMLKTASKNIADLPVIFLTVAVRPTERLVSRVSQWLRKHADNQVVVRFYYSTTLLGGATVEWQGRYVDVSLKKQLNHYLEPRKLAEWMRL